jgi:hypothetical protein
MAYYVQSLVDMQRKPEAFPSGGRGRDGPSSVDWGRPRQVPDLDPTRSAGSRSSGGHGDARRVLVGWRLGHRGGRDQMVPETPSGVRIRSGPTQAIRPA